MQVPAAAGSSASGVGEGCGPLPGWKGSGDCGAQSRRRFPPPLFPQLPRPSWQRRRRESSRTLNRGRAESSGRRESRIGEEEEERKWRRRIIAPIAKLQLSRATARTHLSQPKDTHRPHRPMGSRATELMDSPLMPATHSLRQLQRMGRLRMRHPTGSPPLVTRPQLPPQRTVSPSRGTARPPTTPAPPRLPPPRLPTQHHPPMAPSLPTQPMGSSHLRPFPRDPRMAANQQRPASHHQVQQATTSPA